MSLTYEEAIALEETFFDEYPEFGKIVRTAEFRKKIEDILRITGVDLEHASFIEHEVRLVLSLYVPLHELPENIAVSTGITTEKAEQVQTLLIALVFEEVINELYAFSFLWESKDAFTSKEPLELQPEEVRDAAHTPSEPLDTARPLTRDELMRALAAKRTMQGDIAATKVPEVVSPKDGPVHGYEAYRAKE